MNNFRFINVILLALVLGFGVLIATANSYEFGFVDLQRPGTLLSFRAIRLQAVPGYVRDFVGAIF